MQRLISVGNHIFVKQKCNYQHDNKFKFSIFKVNYNHSIDLNLQFLLKIIIAASVYVILSKSYEFRLINVFHELFKIIIKTKFKKRCVSDT
jgi:hypothetical protein